MASPAARSARASRNLRTDPLFVVKGPRGKQLRGDESEAQHALPDEREAGETKQGDGGKGNGNQQDDRDRQSRSHPEIRALPSGQNVANFSVATKARFKDQNGEQQERTEWHRIVAFGKLADNCQRLLSKGRQVYVEGRLTTRQYEAKDGSGTRYRTEIVALQMRLLGNRTNGTAAPKAEAYDDIPF